MDAELRGCLLGVFSGWRIEDICHRLSSFPIFTCVEFFFGGDDSSTPPIEQIFRPAAISFQERPQTWSWGRSQHHILPSTHAAPSHWRRLGVLLVPLVPLVPGKLESQHLEPRLEQLGTTNRLSILRMFSQSCQGCQGFGACQAVLSSEQPWIDMD